MSGGGSSTVQKSDPWEGVQPLLRQTYDMASGGLDQRLPYYPNQTYANFTPLQEMGMLGEIKVATFDLSPTMHLDLMDLETRYFARSRQVQHGPRR